VGAIVGVGLLETNLKGVNWKFFAKQFLAWVVTIFLMGISCAALFAQVG
jgi:phosphate/sulfate permease